jgi:lipoprotein-anchoring transpeptidase ErfK/SrfK
MGKLIGSAIAIVALASGLTPIRAFAQGSKFMPLPPVSAATSSSAAPAASATPVATGVTAEAATHRGMATPVASVKPAPPPSIDHVFYGNPANTAHAEPAAATPIAAAPKAETTTTPIAAISASASPHSSSLHKPALRVSPPALDALAPRSIDHVFYGHPAGSSPEVATAPAGAASPAPVATPAAAPTAVAAIVPRLPPVLPTPASSSPPAPAAFSPSPTNATAATGSAPHAEDEGLNLYLSDPYSARSSSYNWSVFAFKAHHQMQVFYKRKLFETFHAVFGRSRFAGPKQWEGDRRTPEGDYLIVSKHRSARFRWFLKINYPNAVDQANFLALRADGDVPRGFHEGGSVGIHGTDLQILNDGNVDWTTGCISVDNSAISELARLLPLGTLVVIKP